MEETKNTQTSQGPQKQINVMALICYIGPLCVIPLLINEKEQFVKFHAKQGLVLLGLEVIFSIIFSVIPFFWMLNPILALVWLVLSIIGIMNVVKNEEKELPVIGQFADKLKI